MNLLRFSVAAVVCACVYAAPAAAQDAEAFDSEFAAFKEKLAAAQEAENPVAADALPAAAPANPLGPAASLPVSGSTMPLAAGPLAAGALIPSSPEEMQAQMEAEAVTQQEMMEKQVFDMAIKQLLPLTPEQMRTLYEKFKVSREAAETPIFSPETKTAVQTITLDPSQPPPVIRLAPGYVTTLNVLDSTGAPWPVQDLNFAGKFEVMPPESGGHIVRITPQSAHGTGNMSVRLVDLITPVIFTLVTGLDQVDYRFDARIAKTGPLAKVPIIEFSGLDAEAGTDDNLVAILDGTMPAGADKLKIKGVDGRTTAWGLGGRIYLRTPLSLLSPAWDSSVASADGTTVYTINETPVILLSDNGRMVRAHIAGSDEVIP